MEINKTIITIIALPLLILAGIVWLWMWGMPQYRIYRQDIAGQANLRQQEWEKKIVVEQARAQNEAATLNAEARIKQATAEATAELERAKGVAAAIKVIADSLQGNEAYLRYLWITNLQSGGGKEVIYIPTEAGLPILEAGKR